MFTRVHQHLREKGSFPSENRRAEGQVQRNVEEDENITDMLHRSPRTSTRRISARFCVPRMTDSLANATRRRNVTVPHAAQSAS